jgi:phosphate butyryltransferase
MLNFSTLLVEISSYPIKRVAIAAAHDHTVLEAAVRASQEHVAEALLVGDEAKIREIAERRQLGIDNLTVIDRRDDLEAAATAVGMVADGKADLVMKGYLHTDDFLRAVLHREHGLRAGVLMSHAFAAELPGREGFLFVSDAAMNIAPDLEQKAQIVLNTVHLAHALGYEEPRVGVLAAVELLNPAMPATVDATCLHTMGERRQFSPRCLVDGPFALDNAVSKEAAAHKGITGSVAGAADILVVPCIEAGNMLVKSLVYFAGARVAGIVLGATCPVILTSRADSAESKFLSIALGVYLTAVERHLKLKIGRVHF